MINHNVSGKTSFRRLRLSLMEVAILGAMILVLVMTSLDALEGTQVGQGNALEMAKKQGHQSFIAQRPGK